MKRLFDMFFGFVSARNRAGSGALRQFQFTQTLLDTIPNPVFYKDLQDRYLGCNRAFEELMGRSRGELTGMAVRDAVPKSIADKDKAKDEELLNNPAMRQVYEWKAPNAKTGKVRDVIIQKTVFTGTDGKPAGIVGVISDATELNRVGQELRESETRYRSLYETSQDAIMLLNPSVGFIDANPTTLTLFECETQDAFCSLTPWDLSPQNQPDGTLSRDKAARMINTALEKGTHTFEWKHKTARGREFDAVVSLSRLQLHGGTCVQATVRDVSALKRSEQALRQSRQQLADIIDFLPDATFAVDGEGKISAWNKAMENLTGVEAGEMLGKGNNAYSVPFSGKKQPMLVDLIRNPALTERTRYKFLETGTGNLVAEIFYPNLNGKAVHVWAKAAPLYDPSGNLSGAIETLRDITERKRSEEALREREEQFRALAENSQDIIIRFDREYRFLYANSNLPRQLGRPLEEILGKTHRQLGFPESLPALWEPVMDKVFETGKPQRMIFQMFGAQWLDCFVVPEFDKDGRVRHVISCARDITELKRAEEALREEKERLIVTLRSIGDGVIAADKHGNVVLMNKVAEDNTGWKEAEAFGRPLSEVFRIVNEKTQQPCENPVEKVLRDGKTIALANHTALIARDGSARAIADSGAPIFDAAGGIIGVILVFRDVTGDRRAQESLLLHECALSSTMTGIIMSDFSGRINYANPAVLKMWGFAGASEIEGKSMLDVFRNTGVIKELLEAYREGKPWTGEVLATRVDGSHFDVHVATSLIRDEEGVPIGGIGTITDITERKRKDELLRDFANNLMKLHRASNDIIRIGGGAALHQGICDRALGLAGLDMCWLAFIAAGGERLEIAACAGGGVMPELGELCSLPKSSGNMPWHAIDSLIPRFWNNLENLQTPDPFIGNAKKHGYRSCAALPVAIGGKAQGVLALYSRDAVFFTSERLEVCQIYVNQASAVIENSLLIVSLERKVGERTAELQVQKQLAEEASRAKSAFLANMSHELRTPLNVTTVSATMLSGEMFGKLNEKQKEYADYIVSSSKHLLTLINDILDLSKVEAGKMELSPRRFKAREVMESTAALVRESALSAGSELVCDIAFDAGFEINADERKLKQIIFNLLGNAIKFTPAGGKVLLSAREAPLEELGEGAPAAELAVLNKNARYLLISVKDTGIGIKPEDMDKLFKPFSQVDSSHSRNYEGTGLGLVLVRRFVEMHKGRIWVRSEWQKGSAFTFALPLL
ncbi:MAG: PAS domain S-box protein [Elusimicrobiales bacterium]|nr:PAS domain S-box protein [Elusimicrobiales bacterium]